MNTQLGQSGCRKFDESFKFTAVQPNSAAVWTTVDLNPLFVGGDQMRFSANGAFPGFHEVRSSDVDFASVHLNL